MCHQHLRLRHCCDHLLRRGFLKPSEEPSRGWNDVENKKKNVNYVRTWSNRLQKSISKSEKEHVDTGQNLVTPVKIQKPFEKTTIGWLSFQKGYLRFWPTAMSSPFSSKRWTSRAARSWSSESFVLPTWGGNIFSPVIWSPKVSHEGLPYSKGALNGVFHSS